MNYFLCKNQEDLQLVGRTINRTVNSKVTFYLSKTLKHPQQKDFNRQLQIYLKEMKKEKKKPLAKNRR